MAGLRHIATLLLGTALVAGAASPLLAQEPSRTNTAGAGWLAPGVFVTWEAHRDAPGDQHPLKLDLLVLWRGTPGWFDHDQVSAGAGAPNGRHGVTSRGRSVGLRFDRAADTVRLKHDQLMLQGANVLLLDNVDDPNGLLVAATRQVGELPSVDAQGVPIADPIKALIRRSPELLEFLRCDPVFADPNDPASAITLSTCAALR